MDLFSISDINNDISDPNNNINNIKISFPSFNQNIDLDRIKNICKDFRNKTHLKIKNLQGLDKENFNLVVSYVHLLYNTEYYRDFYNKIKKYFNDLSPVIPGTVGGYFAGCLVDTSF